MEAFVKMVIGLTMVGVITSFQKEIITAVLWMGQLFCRVVLHWRFPGGFF